MNPFEKVPSQNGAKDFLGVGEAVEKGEGRKLLKELEATGQYVFHGSPASSVEVLEPRQPKNWIGGQAVDHGEKSVAATPFADLAIFRALVQQDYTSFGMTDDGPYCAASRKALEFAKNDVGHVYVLPRQNFVPFEDGPMEWRTHEAIKPLRVVAVRFEDLPPDIRVLDEEGNLTTHRTGEKE